MTNLHAEDSPNGGFCGVLGALEDILHFVEVSCDKLDILGLCDKLLRGSGLRISGQRDDLGVWVDFQQGVNDRAALFARCTGDENCSC